MNTRLLTSVAALGVVALLGGCRASTALSYETCLYDTDCIAGTDTCIEVIRGGATTHICSSRCSTGSQCPTDRYGGIGTCVSFDSGARSFCYQTCSLGSTLCEYGSSCQTVSGSGSANICLPGSLATTAAAYAGCAGGMTCQSGTSCVAVKDATTVDLCTVTHCASDAECPLDRRSGRGACVSLDGDSFGTCVERCNSGADCTYPSVERCTTTTHNGVSLPLPGLCLP